MLYFVEETDIICFVAMLYKQPPLDHAELAVIDRIEALKRTLGYATVGTKRWTGLLSRMLFARAIQGSNSIEGYNVTAEDALAAAVGEEPMDATREAWAAVTGYRSAMTYVLQLADDPHFQYSADLLRGLHFMMLNYDLAKHPGQWRPGPIYVRNEERGEVVYEGPDASLSPQLVLALTEALNTDTAAPGLVVAAMAHLNLVMIHPFSDGNGRMARCLQTLVLARQGVLRPEFCSIEEYLGRNTRDYYSVLAQVGQGQWRPDGDARPWVRFCLTAHYRQAMTVLRRSRDMERLWNALEVEVFRRRLPDRSILALSDAAMGLRVRNSTYRAAAEVSEQVASRDLKMLVDEDLLAPVGERRGRVYVAAARLAEIRGKTREPRTDEDPFSDTNATPFIPGFEPISAHTE